MNIDHFLEVLHDSSKKKEDLISMRSNAMKKNAIEHVLLAERVLDERFPLWRDTQSKRGGSKPTDAMFKGERQHFSSEKEAYVWLMECFRTYAKYSIDTR